MSYQNLMKDVSMKHNAMKTSIQSKVLRSAIVTIRALALIVFVPIAVLSQSSTNDAVKQQSGAEQELINLSKQKWRWMSERKVDSLDALFHEKAVFARNVIGTGSVPPAIAGGVRSPQAGRRYQRKVFAALIKVIVQSPQLRTHPLPQVVLTSSKLLANLTISFCDNPRS